MSEDQSTYKFSLIGGPQAGKKTLMNSLTRMHGWKKAKIFEQMNYDFKNIDLVINGEEITIQLWSIFHSPFSELTRGRIKRIFKSTKVYLILFNPIAENSQKQLENLVMDLDEQVNLNNELVVFIASHTDLIQDLNSISIIERVNKIRSYVEELVVSFTKEKGINSKYYEVKCYSHKRAIEMLEDVTSLFLKNK